MTDYARVDGKPTSLPSGTSLAPESVRMGAGFVPALHRREGGETGP
jgi:hypothetical protein